MARVKLSQKYIDNPPPLSPRKPKEEHCDTALPGFFWEQRDTCTEWGTFKLRYKATGKTTTTTIGRSCDLSLSEARQKAKDLKAEIRLGANPQAKVLQKKQSMFWDSYFTQRYLPHIKQHLRSWANLEEMHRLRISERFGHLRLNQITKHQVQQFHAELKESGLAPATADHHLKLIRQALNMAVEWDLLKINPAAKVKLFNIDNKEERLMTDEELQRLMAAIDAEKNSTASLVVKFLLLTGARVNEALHAKWSDIDRNAKTWIIQATNSKSKRRRSVPLNSSALAVLDQLKSEGKSEWLFTSSRGDGNSRMTTINKKWQKLRQAAGLPKLRLHDLRHQYASMLVNSGRTLYEVQQILGHSSSDVTQRYAHLSSASLQEAANSASDAVNAAIKSGS